jgi:Domain of unknown function (DUF4157)
MNRGDSRRASAGKAPLRAADSGPRQTPGETQGVALAPPAYGIDFVDSGMQADAPVQRASPNRTGMPDPLKTGIESLSGMDLSEVRVHANSAKPAEVQALAYAQGNDIHLAPGQETHLPHEAWHVVQQRQGRVQPTMHAAGVAINEDPALESEADAMGVHATRHRPEEAHPALAAGSAARPVVQRVKGNAVAGLSEEQWGQVASGQTIRYTPLAAGCMAVTVFLDGGGAAGVHLAMEPGNTGQWRDFRNAISGKTVTAVRLDSEFLGMPQGWYVKFKIEGLPTLDDPDADVGALAPETEVGPRSYADLHATMTDQEINYAGWTMDQGSIVQWFRETLGADVQISANTNPAHTAP